MKFHRFAPSAALLLGLGCLGSAKAYADVEYTYTGTNFTTVSSPYSTSDLVTGYFLLSDPLAANLQNASITPLSFSFSDGLQNITNQSNNVFAYFQNIYTNGSGDITGIFVNISATTGNIEVTSSGASARLFVGQPEPTASSGAGGTWVISTIPEPYSVSVLGAGLLALVVLRSRRKALPA